jgi:predicted nucleic acid-binding Zn ribbon protein
MKHTSYYLSYFCDRCQNVFDIPYKSKKQENEVKYCNRCGPYHKTRLRKLEGFKKVTKTMPLFTYLCTKCNHEEEHLVKDYKTKVKCKNCDIDMKILSSKRVSTKFIGPGWAADGYSNAPVDNMSNSSDELPTTVRIPHYADKNTGKYLGTGTPEIPIGKD